jgi:hypothetical protein
MQAMQDVYFAVVSWQGREQGRVFYDQVPPALAARGSPLLYCTRLSDSLAALSIQELMLWYRGAKAMRRLPAEVRGKPAAAKPETRISREYWQPPPVTWDRDAPAYPPLSPSAALAAK